MDTTPLPRPARWLGPAGLLPFLALALAAHVAPEVWRDAARFGLAAYGALILAFLGGVHWGLALRAPAAEAGAAAPRLGLGVLPSLLGWVALMLPPGPGFALLAAGILGTALVESWAAWRGLVPRGYLWLRWALSLGASSCLLAGMLA
jgi:hypothetical protein